MDLSVPLSHLPAAAQLAVADVLAERDRQRQRFNLNHDKAMGTNDWVALLTRHNGLAVNDGGSEALDRFRKQMVRVAATALAAIETMDRARPLAGKPFDLGVQHGTEGREK